MDIVWCVISIFVSVLCICLCYYCAKLEDQKYISDNDCIDMHNKLIRCEDERWKLQKKVNEYEKIIENIKESLPF